MSLYLGFDGGGTKTECVAVDASGREIARGLAGPSNPLRVSFESATAALIASAAEALDRAHLPKEQVRAVCAGLAGAGRPNVARTMASSLSEAFPNCLVDVTTDLEIALEAAAENGPGVVLIAGTGSCAYGRNAAGRIARAGGYGPWIGDEGSAYDMGRRAVAAVARTRDLAAPATRLEEMVPTALEGLNWDELTERIARNPDAVFPRLFPVVVEAAQAGDSAAREILFTSAMGLASMAMTVVRRLHLKDEEFVLAKSGGVFGRSRLFDAMLDSALSGGLPHAKIGLLGVSPAVGAARRAARLAASQPRGGPGDASGQA